MNYTFGLRGHDIADNFADMCKKAKAGGITKLQLAMTKTMTDIDFDAVGYDAELSKSVGTVLAENDLHISVLGCYISPVHSDKDFLKTQLKRFENFLYYARDLGANCVGTETPGYISTAENHSEKAYREFIENMRPIVKKAEKLGVIVGIEPVYYNVIWSPQTTERMLRDIDSPNLKVILDISNMTHLPTRHMQCDIINDSFDLFGEKIVAVHLKDFTFDGDTKHYAVAGTGELMTELIFDRLTGLSYTPEIILDETKIELYPDCISALREILE